MGGILFGGSSTRKKIKLSKKQKAMISDYLRYTGPTGHTGPTGYTSPY